MKDFSLKSPVIKTPLKDHKKATTRFVQGAILTSSLLLLIGVTLQFYRYIPEEEGTQEYVQSSERARFGLPRQDSSWIDMNVYSEGIPQNTELSAGKRQQKDLAWKNSSPGIAVATIDLANPGLLTSRVLAVKVDLEKVLLKILLAKDYGRQRASLRWLTQKSGAIAGINANFFDENGDALGLVYREGRTESIMHRGGKTLTGILELTGSNARIIHRDGYQNGESNSALQAGPRLMVKGEPVPNIRDSGRRRRRTIACLPAPSELILLVTDGLFGLTEKEVSELVTMPALKCNDALNFDGGGSTQMYLKERDGELSVPGKDLVPVGLGLFPREQ